LGVDRRYRLIWRRFLRSIWDEKFLAEHNYGVDLSPTRHKDLILINKARAELCTKLLREAAEFRRDTLKK